MASKKIFLTTAFLFGICVGQHHHVNLYGTMYDIPAKIHREIFGGVARRSLPLINLSNFNGKSYLSTPLLPQERSPDIGLNFNNIAYGFGHVQMPRSNTSAPIDRIPLATELFAPAIVKNPAATKGQVEAYMKALQEQMKEAEKEMQKMLQIAQESKPKQSIDTKAISYVNVRFGGNQNVNYHYTSI